MTSEAEEDVQLGSNDDAPPEDIILEKSSSNLLAEEVEELEKEEHTEAVETIEKENLDLDQPIPEFSSVEDLFAKPKGDPEEIIKHYNRTPNDTNDPSYTNLTLPYRVICRMRYRAAAKMQREQFIQEIKVHELLRVKALDGVRIHREFCDPIISRVSSEELVPLTKKQQERLHKLLNEP